jgi:hypothetical protein
MRSTKMWRWTHSSKRIALFVGALLSNLLPCEKLQAAAIPATVTPIESDATRMISYRHQEHAWQTADGATHFLVNRGTLSSGASLTLYSTTDQGITWSDSLQLNNTNAYASADGVLIGNELWVAFSSSASTILFAVLTYDELNVAWTLSRLQRVFQSTNQPALNPGIAIDEDGAVWCGFVTRDRNTNEATIRMSQRSPLSSTWVDTGLSFGATDNISVERSARPVVIPGGVGMVYSVHETLNWATRQNEWPIDQEWTNEELFRRSVDDVDPYASHFSVGRDSLNNLHMAVADRGRLRYLHYAASSLTWETRLISSDISATYPQVAVQSETDILMIWTNTSGGNVTLSQSADRGASFVATDFLWHPPSESDVSYQNPRIEAPSVVSGSVVVVQQYADGPLQKLLSFDVAPLGGTAFR